MYLLYQYRRRLPSFIHAESVPLNGSKETTTTYYLHRLVARRLVLWAGPGKRGPISGLSARARVMTLRNSDRYLVSKLRRVDPAVRANRKLTTAHARGVKNRKYERDRSLFVNQWRMQMMRLSWLIDWLIDWWMSDYYDWMDVTSVLFIDSWQPRYPKMANS